MRKNVRLAINLNLYHKAEMTTLFVFGLTFVSAMDYIYDLKIFIYFQPPYRKGEAFLEMRLMTHGELDLERSFERVKTIIHQNVYGVK